METITKIYSKVTENIIIFVFLMMALGIYFSFGLHHIDNFTTVDERLWISDPYVGRIQFYWKAIGNQEWMKTRINDKPGVTLAVISGLGTIRENNPEEKVIDKGRLARIYNPDKQIEVNFLYRFPILVFNGLIGLLFFWQIKRLLDSSWLALFAAILIELYPITIGISQIVNPDSLLWSCSFAALLSFLVFLKKNSLVDAFVAALFLGLALGSKYAAIIMYIYFYILLFIYLWYHAGDFIDRKKLRKKVLVTLLPFPFIILGGIGIFSILMPAVFLNPDFLYKATLGFKGSKDISDYIYILTGIIGFFILDAIFLKSLLLEYLAKYTKYVRYVLPRILYASFLFLFGLVIYNWTIGHNFLNIGDIPFDIGREKLFKQVPDYQKILLELRPLVFSLSPMVLVLTIYVWIRSLIRRTKYDYVVFSLSVFLVIFYLAVLKQGLLVHIRYSIILYPIMILIATVAISDLFYLPTLARRIIDSKIISKIFKRDEKEMEVTPAKPSDLSNALTIFYRSIIIGAATIGCIYTIETVRPFYFNYTSPFLPKNDIITGAWGYGGFEAAQFLNKNVDTKNTIIWSDYDGVCEFYFGKCIKGSQIKWFNSGNFTDVEYFIGTRRGNILSKSTWLKLEEQNVLEKVPVWELNIDERPKNFIRIYKVSEDFKKNKANAE